MLWGASDSLDQCRVMILEAEPGCMERHGVTIQDLEAEIERLGFRIEERRDNDLLCLR